MNSHKIALLGSVAAALALGWVQASAASPLPAANSYADLLEPVDNAQMVLAGDDLARDQQPRVQLVQYDYDHHHHHHHRYYHHHHHHHHFRPGFGVVIGPDVRHCFWRRHVYVNDYGERIIRRVRVCD